MLGLLISLCICDMLGFLITLFLQNVVLDILKSHAFKKYSTCWVFQALCICVNAYFCISVFHILYTGMSYIISMNPMLFIFSCPEQLNRWPCHWLSHSQYFYFWHTKSDPRDLWPLRNLIRMMRRHDLTEKDLPTYRVSFSKNLKIFR